MLMAHRFVETKGITKITKENRKTPSTQKETSKQRGYPTPTHESKSKLNN
jgi:hypothetical protein